MTAQREGERTEDFIPMFEAGDIQALAEATDHSVSSLLGLALCWALRRDWEQGGRLEFVLEELWTTEGRGNVLAQGSPCSPTTLHAHRVPSSWCLHMPFSSHAGEFLIRGPNPATT